MTTSDFDEGDSVLYVPHHARNDVTHRDCESGVVSSTNANYVFVRYYRKGGGLPSQAQATLPRDLVLMEWI